MLQELDFAGGKAAALTVPQHTTGLFLACRGTDCPTRFGVDTYINGGLAALPRTGRVVEDWAVVPVPNYALAFVWPVRIEFEGHAVEITVTERAAPAGYDAADEDAEALQGALETLEAVPDNLLCGTALNNPTKYTVTERGTIYPAEGIVEFNHSAVGLTDYLNLSAACNVESFKPGGTYTVSYEYKYTVVEKGATNPLHGGEFAIKYADGTTKWYGKKPTLASTDNKWVKWSNTFTLESDLGEVTSVDFRLYQRDIQGALRFKNVKLSEGTFTGRWTMSPDDTDQLVARYDDANGWKVKKWASGDMEASLNVYQKVNVTNAYYSYGTYYTNIYYPLPDGATGTHAVIGDVLSGDMTTGKVVDITADQITYRIFNQGVSLANEELRLFMHYFGYWK